MDATIMKHVNEFLESVEGCREIAWPVFRSERIADGNIKSFRNRDF